ncbi:uncharacterized protein LOC115333183 [Ixodes scapularis]|uniref:uncharacterized protein LOC115333183 n=1 Tax=Ixodes scapularis TaxID=6945 RepID=UPI001A9D526F|nr:uncharacterized protein LOC115333183 [Ixodes scapularis]
MATNCGVMCVPVVITTGFKAVQDPESFFRGANLVKGQLLYESGHVYEVREVHYDTHVEITARCTPQTKLNAAGKHIELQLDKDRTIVLAKCDCRAGVAGKCKHAAAVAVYLERDAATSKTSCPRSWGIPSSKKAYPKFSRVTPNSRKGVSVSVPALAVSHVGKFFPDLDCPLTDMLRAEETCSHDEGQPLPFERPLSPDVLELFDWPQEGFRYRNFVMMFDSGKPVQKEETFLASLTITERAVYDSSVSASLTRIGDICRDTSLSKDMWRKERLLRITATKAHKVIRCKGDLREVAKNMVLDAPFTSQATAHRQRYEPEARAKFEETRNLKVHQLGLVVMPQDPWLGCSPDGLFRNEDGNVMLLEIKCPSSRWKKPLTEKPLLAYLAECKQRKDIVLRKSHTYYTQIQICMYVLQLDECDLFLYCSVDKKTLHIKRDEEFLSDAIPKLRSFYFTHYIQELAALQGK